MKLYSLVVSFVMTCVHFIWLITTDKSDPTHQVAFIGFMMAFTAYLIILVIPKEKK